MRAVQLFVQDLKHATQEQWGRPVRALAAGAALLVLLSAGGCGQRGPLYLPNGAGGATSAPPSTSLLSTPFFPGLPLSSDTTVTVPPAPSMQVTPSAVLPQSTSDDPNAPNAPADPNDPDQPGLKFTPRAQ